MVDWLGWGVQLLREAPSYCPVMEPISLERYQVNRESTFNKPYINIPLSFCLRVWHTRFFLNIESLGSDGKNKGIWRSLGGQSSLRTGQRVWYHLDTDGQRWILHRNSLIIFLAILISFVGDALWLLFAAKQHNLLARPRWRFNWCWPLSTLIRGKG